MYTFIISDGRQGSGSSYKRGGRIIRAMAPGRLNFVKVLGSST